MSPRTTCFCLVLAIVAAPRSSSAQDQNPASIPTELAQALLGRNEYGPARGPRLFVDRAPEGMPQSLTSLEGGRLLGGMEYDRSEVVVIAFTLPPNQVVLSVDRQLRARGWAPPPPPEAQRGGFVSTNGAPFGNVYCADSVGLSLVSMPAPGGGTYLKLTELRNQQFGFCRPHEQDRPSFGSEFKYPALLAPPGMTAHSSGSGSGGASSSISTRLSGPLKPAELVAHYRAQLDAAGWRTRTPITSGEEAAIAYVEAADSNRVVWRGMMTALQVGPSDIDVEIKMVRPPGR